MRFRPLIIDDRRTEIYNTCMKTLIGREKECERLEKCLKATTSQLVVVYGRRRVGKTFLINQFFKNKLDFKVTGAYGQPKNVQLRNFADELNRRSVKEWTIPKDWIQAFNFLREYIEQLSNDEKHIFFIDEMPWLDTHKSGFLPAFEYFWNDFGSSKDNLVFIICGSATSWMVDNVTNNKGGLFNRQTCRIYLEPFSLFQTREYLQTHGMSWSEYNIAECYMIMGGIPYYLSLLDSEMSYVQNIDNLFFRKKAELWDEFEHLYRTLFSNSDKYVAIMECLAEKRSGYTRNEIADKMKIAANGKLTKILENLINSGFVRASSFYGNRKKETLYQSSDYYTNFYFKFLKDNHGKDEHYWSKALDAPVRRSWAGLTFEQLCKDHINQIKEKLGISGVLSEEYIWFARENEELGTSGAQIDLLIERRDRVINICEIKFVSDEFIIDKEYELNLRNKIETFKRNTKTKYGLQLTMITTYGVKNNKYSSIVGNQILLEDLFK